jgi:hypothetical protein
MAGSRRWHDGHLGAHLSEEASWPRSRPWWRPRRKAKKEAEKCEEGAKQRSRRKRARATACRRSRSSPSGRNYLIVFQPPTRIPVRELESFSTLSADVKCARPPRAVPGLPIHAAGRLRHLLERFQAIDAPARSSELAASARGRSPSCPGRDQEDPLFLQVMRPRPPCWSGSPPKSWYKQHGSGGRQRMMQAASDIYLGWTKGVEENRWLWPGVSSGHEGRPTGAMKPFGLEFYARQCGRTPRAHARSATRRDRRASGRATADRRSPTSPSDADQNDKGLLGSRAR